MNISFIMPGRDNLKFARWSYESIRKNQGNHTVEICFADDASTDGTWEWCLKTMKKDPLFKPIRNEGAGRQGLVILNDRLINEVATSDLCMVWHCDMYLAPGALDAIEKHMFSTTMSADSFDQHVYKSPNRKTIVSLTRIEPPLHPPGPEKIIVDCGVEPENFDEFKLLDRIDWIEQRRVHPAQDIKPMPVITEGIFAPWAFWKNEFQEIGGHDKLFAPQSKEDSDIFNRFALNGTKFIQTWEGFVYHMTCRGSRFNPSVGGAPGVNSPEWIETTTKNTFNFIRKWGTTILHDQYLKPIVLPRYITLIHLKNITSQDQANIIKGIEPFFDYISVDFPEYYLDDMIKEISLTTTYNISDKFKKAKDINPSIKIELDMSIPLTEEVINLLTNLPRIIQDQELEIGKEYKYLNTTIIVNNLDNIEKDLIKANNEKS